MGNTDSLGLPRVEHDEGGWGYRLKAHAGKLALLVGIGLLMAFFASGLTQEGFLNAFMGEGYVRWVKNRWQAQQDAAKVKKPLLVYRFDTRHADHEALIELIDTYPQVQELTDGFIWHKDVSSPEGEVHPPEFEIYSSTNPEELLLEATPVTGMTPGVFATHLIEAVEADRYSR